MRILIVTLLLLIAGEASANEFYYVVYNIPAVDGVHFASPDDACQYAYNYDQTVTFPKWADGEQLTPLPYESPHVFQSFPPKLLEYQCDTSATVTHVDDNGNITGTDTFSGGYYINRMGNDCTDAQYYNPVSGLCQTSDQEQANKEFGDPSNPLVVGAVSCGDPVNIGTGNVFEEETDYADTDGELVFSRNYNSLTGVWRHSYSTQIVADSFSIALIFADGRQSAFSIDNNVATAEPGEMGSMTLKNGLWTYTSPSNETMTFERIRGRLTQWTSAAGLTQNISYVDDASFNSTATVTDSQGHSLTFKSDISGRLSQMSAGSLVTTYQVDTTNRMVSVSKQWPSQTKTRSYLYEDSSNPKKLTGVIDERGIRSATWAYDSQGRATSNERPGGAGKIAIAYSADGSVIVTNALGNDAIYRYSVVQGVKRVVSINGSPAPGCPASNSSYTYTTLGQVATRTDARGNITSYTYDDLGRETRRVEAAGSSDERVVATTWSGTTFRPATVTTPDQETTYSYDDKGRLLSTQNHSVKE